MDRRKFLQIGAALTAGAAAAGYLSGDLVKLASAAVLPASGRSSIKEDLRVPHLLRRASFGEPPERLEAYESMGFDRAVSSLLNYSSTPESSLPPPAIRLAYSGRTVPNELYILADWWLQKMALTTRPLEERMTLFWHNHFATGYSKVLNGYLMYQQNQFLRANALGNFADILQGMTSDGAMLFWLDNNANPKLAPNENFGREVLEVFTTGRGPYTEADVQAGARIFTGYSVGDDGTGVFHPDQHDDSVKTYLGKTGDFMPQDGVEILAARPETAANLATELFEYFVHPNPPSEAVGRLAEVYLQSGYSVKAVVEAILTSDDFLSEAAYLANVKSPVEYVVSSLRATRATAVPLSGAATIDSQGQLLFDPPSVFGWPSGIAWIDTGSMIERFNFPVNMQTASQDESSRFDPTPFSGGTPDSAVSSLAQALIPEGLPAAALKVIQSSSSNFEDPDMRAVNAARLVMSTPLYNLN